MKYKVFFLSILFIIVSFFIFKFAYSDFDPKSTAQELLNKADITINGNSPWDMTINNDNLFLRVLNEGSIGLGESFMDGWWDSKQLDQFFYKILSSDLNESTKINLDILVDIIKAKILNLQSKERAFEVGEQHYDLSNELFNKMLDSRMIYSCGYWKNAKNLDDAQDHKLDLICKKLGLKPGMKVLDIGCGWGGLAKYMAENYGVDVTGITISKEQAKYAQEICRNLPIKILVKDYRDMNETFDRVVSVGMFEHVGYKNYEEYMRTVHKCLKDDGLFLLHTIGGNTSQTMGDAWLNKYIFPNGMLPSVSQIANAIENLFILEDWHNFGPDYDKTLMAWFDNFENNWNEIKQKYDERFYRMWKYYLLSCAGLFRSRKAQLWQIVLSKKGILGGYNSIR